MRWPNWPRWVWRYYAATFAGLAAFVVCSFLPMWEISDVLSGCVCVESRPPGPLWQMLTFREPGPHVVYLWQTPAIVTAIAMQIAAVVGFFWGGVRWRSGKQVPTEPERG